MSVLTKLDLFGPLSRGKKKLVSNTTCSTLAQHRQQTQLQKSF